MRTPSRPARPGRLVSGLLVLLPLAACGGDGSTTAPPGDPARIQKITPDGQTATAGMALPDSVEVRVLDEAGTPVSDVTVVWSVVEGGGRVSPSNGLTRSNGVARARWELGQPGQNTLSVDVAGGPSTTLGVTAVAATLSFSSPLPEGDTIDAFAPDPLRVTLTDHQDRAIAAMTVRVRGIAHERGDTVPSIRLRHLDRNDFSSLVTLTTDEAGAAEAGLRLGPFSGVGRAEISVPDLGLADTLEIPIGPGNPVAFRFTPPDTAVYPDASYALGIDALDRQDSVRGDHVVTGASANVAFADGRLQGISEGRGYVAAESGPVVDTAWVSVVPPGGAAAYLIRRHTGEGIGLVTFELDGADLTQLVDYPDAIFEDMSPAWSPDGQRLVYQYGGNEPRLYTVDLQGTISRLTQADEGIGMEEWGEYTRDGSWIYFTATDNWSGTGATQIWRVRSDGTEMTRMTPSLDYRNDGPPSPSPAPDRVVYASRGGEDYINWKLRMLHVDPFAIDSMDIRGESPRWSPVADLIGFVDEGSLKVMHPDGSGQRVLVEAHVQVEPGISWSPDGRWLVARSAALERLIIVRAEDGEVLPLPYTTPRMAQPAWRP